MFEQRFANALAPKIGMNVETVDKINLQRHKSNRLAINLGHPDIIIRQNMCCEIIAVFLKGMTLFTLKIRQ
jgi:hypothetical protein